MAMRSARQRSNRIRDVQSIDGGAMAASARHALGALGVAIGLFAEPAVVNAQTYPTKPIRLVAPFPPGGGTDLLSRIIAVPITESFGQPVIVDNRPGAGGFTGAEIVARSEPDGHTLILVSGSYAATSAYRKTSYDPVDGIQP